MGSHVRIPCFIPAMASFPYNDEGDLTRLTGIFFRIVGQLKDLLCAIGAWRFSFVSGAKFFSKSTVIAPNVYGAT